MIRFTRLWPLVVLAGALLSAWAAQAQTALIAHRSHAGSVRTFRPGSSAHNFGLPPPTYVTERVEWLGGTTAIRHTRVIPYWGSAQTRVDTVDLRALTRENNPKRVVQRLRELYPKARLVGFNLTALRDAWPAE